MTTRSEIIEIAHTIRQELTDIHGYCWPASKQLSKALVSQTEATADEVAIEEVLVGAASCRHYVVAYPARYVDDIDAKGRIIVDITLDQYSDQNVEDGLVKASVEDKIQLKPVYIFAEKSAAPYSG